MQNGRRKLTESERTAMRQEALDRARNCHSLGNMATVVREFSARGIPVAEINPGENCLTYPAWQALGRQVRRGEKGVKVTTYVQMTKAGTTEGEEEQTYSRPWTAAVFHVTQTDEAVQR